jgi:ribonuclease P/MRP protein subunit RPP40
MGDCFTEWVDVISGVPQGSVLGPILFLVFINDLPNHINNECRLYADDNKVIAPISSEDDAFNFQNDIYKLDEWSEKWSMALNFEKCKIMHFGKNNVEYPYYLKNNGVTQRIETSSVEKDVGIYISDDLKWSKQVRSAACKANNILSVIDKTFTYKDKNLIRMLYCTYVRPHLEFAIQAWCPYFMKDIDELEKIQHRATKLKPELRHLDYRERLKALNLTTLEIRRLRGDLIQVFKIMKGFEVVELSSLSIIDSLEAVGPASATRGHKMRIKAETVSNYLPRKNFFSNRVVFAWNRLPNKVIESTTINQFKNNLDAFKLEEVLCDMKKIKTYY